MLITIDDTGNKRMQRAIVLTPPAQSASTQQQLGFYAHSILVENPTAAYWYLPDQLRYIPPFVTGMVIPLNGTQVANIIYAAPPGLQQPAQYTQTGSATFTYDEEPISNDSGMSLSANAFGRSVGIIPITFGTPATIFTFVLPAPNGFIIIPSHFPSTARLTVNIGFTSPIGGLDTRLVWARNYGNGLTGLSGQLTDQSQMACCIYKRPIPAQAQISLFGDSIPASLII